MNPFLIVVLNCIAVSIEFIGAKPIPNEGSNFISLNQTIGLSQRVRRSIPEMELSSDYTNIETQPEEIPGEPIDTKNDISLFSLTDNVSNLFRSHKNTKTERKSRPMADHISRQVNTMREEESVEGGVIPSDEQEECYRQQNIDPPMSAVNEKMKFRLSKGIDSKKVFIDMASNNHPPYVRSGLKTEKSGRFYNDKTGEKTEVLSLYSSPQKEVMPKKVKHYPIPKRPEIFDSQTRIYKPVGVEAKFPIYDEDIDFHPDPLQGILEDKYWLDPQEQEAVIRKYIDLASNNMMPRGVEYPKAKQNKRQSELRSVKSEEAYKDSVAGGGCPCKEISACGDCGKGRERKKSNSSRNVEEVSVFGGNRKLLGSSYDNIMNSDKYAEETFKQRTSTALQPQDINMNKGVNKELLNKMGIKETQISEEFPVLLSKELDCRLISNVPSEDFKENSGEKSNDVYTESNNVGNNALNFGRKLLWYYEEDEESDIEDNDYKYKKSDEFRDDSNVNSKMNNAGITDLNYNSIESKPISQVVKTDIIQEPKNQKNKIYKKTNGGYKTKHPSVGSIVQSQNLNEWLEDNYRHDGEDLTELNPALKTYHKPPRYYVPNKMANVLQKPLGKKPVYKNTTVINVNQVFKEIQNETLNNAVIEVNRNETVQKISFTTTRNTHNMNMTTSSSAGYNSAIDQTAKRTYLHKQKSKLIEDRLNKISPKPSKGRRSYSEISNIKSDSLFPLVPISEDSQSFSINGSKNPENTSSSANPLFKTTVSTIKPSGDVSITHTTHHGYLNISTSIPEYFNDRNKAEEEEALDTKVANNIVETVISETHRDSIRGQNLGICRKNDSLGKSSYEHSVAPDTEKVMQSITNCIMNKLKVQMASQSCSLLDPELLRFVKWLVLEGEAYRYYMQKTSFRHDFTAQQREQITVSKPTCEPVYVTGPIPPQIQKEALHNIMPVY